MAAILFPPKCVKFGTSTGFAAGMYRIGYHGHVSFMIFYSHLDEVT